VLHCANGRAIQREGFDESNNIRLGPFHPAIRWYNNLWVAEAEYKTKDEAKDEALALVGALNKRTEGVSKAWIRPCPAKDGML